jgi:hypothetical protein
MISGKIVIPTTYLNSTDTLLLKKIVFCYFSIIQSVYKRTYIEGPVDCAALWFYGVELCRAI